MKNQEIYTSRKSEFETLKAKLDVSKGYMQGLTLIEYNRINSLHAYLLSFKN